MLLLPRFYIETEDIVENIVEEKRGARFVDSKINKSGYINIFHEQSDNSGIIIDNTENTPERYIAIEDKIYKKNKSDKMLSDLATYFSRYYEIESRLCLLPIRMNDDDILIKNNYTDETYILFRSFEELYIWLKKYHCDFCMKEYLGTNHVINDKDCINRFYKLLESWFEDSDKNILFLKTAPYIKDKN